MIDQPTPSHEGDMPAAPPPETAAPQPTGPVAPPPPAEPAVPPPAEPSAPSPTGSAAPPPSNPKKPIYKTWWFWVVAIVLIGAVAYAVSLAVDGGVTPTDGNGLGPAATGNETETVTPSEPATANPKEPSPTPPTEPPAGGESEARAFAPDITTVIGDVDVIEGIIAQMKVAGHEDYKVEDGDNGEKHYIWTFSDGSKLIIVMVPASTGDKLAFERVDIVD